MTRWTVNAGLLVATLGLVTPASDALASPEPEALRAAWRDYAARESQRDPVGEYPYEYCFRRAAAAYGLPLSLLLAVARGESSFQPWARSDANAYGLMQILWPDTAYELGIYRVADLFDPCTNVEAGARYLKMLRGRYGGDLHLALAAYNYGPNRIAVNAGRIPRGASWYSGYIYRNLRAVLGETSGSAVDGGSAEVDGPGRRKLITFGNPGRAEAYIESLRKTLPSGRFEWFRTPKGYEVYLAYAGAAELSRARSALASLGLSLR
jgi:hypothetical protein